MKRREFITLSAKSLGGLLVYTLAREPVWLNAQEGTIGVPSRDASASSRSRTVSAVVHCMQGCANSTGKGCGCGIDVYIHRCIFGGFHVSQ